MIGATRPDQRVRSVESDWPGVKRGSTAIDRADAERQNSTEKNVYVPFTLYEGPIMNELITETMKISDVRSNLNTLVNEVYRHEKRVIIEKSGIPVAVIISPNDLERFDFLVRKREERFKIVDEIRAKFAGIPPEELEEEALKAVAQVRAEARAKRQQAVSGG